MIKRLLAVGFLSVLLCGCLPDSSSCKVLLKFSAWGSDSEVKIVKQMIARYEKENPGVKIVLFHTPQNYFKKLHLLFASKTEPDVILINNQNIVNYSKYLTTLDKSKYKDDFFEVALNTLSVHGELKAVPRDISNLVIYYNKTLLEQNGISVPKPQWTFVDFLEVSKILKEKGIFSILLENDLFYVYPFILSFGENAEGITDDNLYQYKSVTFYRALSEKYHYSPMDYEIGQSTGAEFFLSGKSAFYLSGRWMIPKIRELAAFEWDILPFPTGKAGSKVPCDATGVGIALNTKYPVEALQFVEYLTSKEVIQKISETGLILPARKSVAFSDTFLKGKPEHGGYFLDIAQNSVSLKYPANYNYVKDKINGELKNIKWENPTGKNSIKP